MAAFSPTLRPGTRVQALDVLRGFVIVLMALDHVRDFFHESGYAYDPLDLSNTTAVLYATRWVTHFCAPTFVFLAGVSVWLQRARGKDRSQLARFLLTRGLWLVVLEVTVVSFGWAFSIPLLFLLQVIWAIGWSMVALAALVFLSPRAVLAVALVIVAGHNLLDPIQARALGAWEPVWLILFERGLLFWHGAVIALVAYPIVPWFGVLALGYALGPIFQSPARDRKLILLSAGMLALFVVLRTLNLYGDPRPWMPRETVLHTAMDFFNVEKYPPSLLYVCVTLPPMLLLVPLFDRWRGAGPDILRTFGSVPLIAYLAHIYVLHALAIAWRAAAGQSLDGMFNTIHDLVLAPGVFAGTGAPLAVVYVAWIVVLAFIYPLCRWWGAVKQHRREWWMSYL